MTRINPENIEDILSPPPYLSGGIGHQQSPSTHSPPSLLWVTWCSAPPNSGISAWSRVKATSGIDGNLAITPVGSPPAMATIMVQQSKCVGDLKDEDSISGGR